MVRGSARQPAYWQAVDEVLKRRRPSQSPGRQEASISGQGNGGLDGPPRASERA